jgi:endo-1,4-beta-xylanase
MTEKTFTATIPATAVAAEVAGWSPQDLSAFLVNCLPSDAAQAQAVVTALADHIKPPVVTPPLPLRAQASARGLLYGASSGWQALHDESFAAAFAKECGLLVSESELKMAAVRPTATTFKFDGPDWLSAFAQLHGMLFRGHTLIWHQALPGWFSTVTSSTVAAAMKLHINGVVGHYAGKMHSWDVVNEAVAPWEGRADGLRNSKWMQLMGPTYIDQAFKLAAAADPAARLVLNQDRLEYDAEVGTACRKHTLALLRRLLDAKVPVHALGIESHLGLDPGKFDAEVFRRFLEEVAALGLKIMITELDVTDQIDPADIVTRDRLVAQRYADYLAVCLDQPAVTTIITWGLSDQYTWIADQRKRADGLAVRPLPLAANLARKPAWDALHHAFIQ